METEAQQKKTVKFALAEPIKFNGNASQSPSLRSITEQPNPRKSERDIDNHVLPLNFFHSPGEYNRMLIRSSVIQVGSAAERQLGIIRNLQFMNEPIFTSQIQQRSKRIHQYCRSHKLKSASTVTNDDSPANCCCCCCDNYCVVCANETRCQQSERESKPMGNLLIDIEAMKKGQIRRVRKGTKPHQNQVRAQTYVWQEVKQNKYKINQLITASLVKQIEQKRRRQLIELQSERKMVGLRKYNQQVRSINRSTSVPKAKELHKSFTNYQLRKMYWSSKKKYIASELKKDIDRNKHSEISVTKKCHQRQVKLSADDMKKLRLLHEQQALMKEARLKMKKQQVKKIKEKKLLALAAKQAQIVNNCPSRLFKPTPDMIESAFVLD